MIKGIIFDIDGVLCRGTLPIPGAATTVNSLKDKGYKIIFLSNLSTKSRDQYIDKLKGFGIKVTPDEMVLATSAAAAYVRDHASNGKVYVIGAEGLKEEIRKAGLMIVDEPEEAEFVVAGSPFDEEGYVKEENRWCFTGALRAIKNGARFVAVNPDVVFPGKDGKLIPGTGAFLGAVTAMTGVEPVVVGKPSPVIVKIALDKLSLKPEECLMVGDQIPTDMKAGKSAGLYTALVLTGVTSKEDVNQLKKEDKALIDHILESINDIFNIL